MEGALAKDAESKLWAWADAAERQALERIFIQLVRPGEQLDAGEHGSDTRRVAARTEFSEGDWALIHRLASTRLVVVTRRPTGRDTAELAHQALVEKWPQLQRWVEENREFRGWQEELRRSLQAWQEQGRPKALALGREQVTETRRWIDARASEVPVEEAEFVATSAQVQQLAPVGAACSSRAPPCSPSSLSSRCPWPPATLATAVSSEQRALAAGRS